MKYIYLLILTICTIPSLSQGLTDSIGTKRRAYETHLEWLRKDGGKWESPNASYDSKEEWSAVSYGYTFKEGYSPSMLKLQITGKIKDKNYVFWEGYYFWDVVKNKPSYFATGTSGQVAQGEAIYAINELYFEIMTHEGNTTRHIDREIKITDDQFKAEAYVFKDGKWNFERASIWTRVRK